METKGIICVQSGMLTLPSSSIVPEFENWNLITGSIYTGYIQVPVTITKDNTDVVVPIYGLMRKMYNSDIVTGYLGGIIPFQNYQIPVRGFFKGVADVSQYTYTECEETAIIDSNSDQMTTRRYYDYLIPIKSLSGTVSNTQQIPEHVRKSVANYRAYGWLNGIDDLTYNGMFYNNQISGNLINQQKNCSFNQQYSGIITVPVRTDVLNYVSGVVIKPKGTMQLSGYLYGDVQVQNQMVYMGGLFKGTASSQSKKNIYVNQQLVTSIRPTVLRGTLYNVQPLTDQLRHVIDIKQNNALGRKNLTKQYSLFGQNLNYASKNYNIIDRPYMVQTWKIVKYNVQNVPKKLIHQYNQDYIDISTRIATSKQVRNKRAIDNMYTINKTIQLSDYNQLIPDWYYCYFDTDRNQRHDICMTVGNKWVIERSDIPFNNIFAGPFNDIRSVQGQILKGFAISTNMMLVDKRIVTYQVGDIVYDVYKYYFEHTQLQV